MQHRNTESRLRPAVLAGSGENRPAWVPESALGFWEMSTFAGELSKEQRLPSPWPSIHGPPLRGGPAAFFFPEKVAGGSGALLLGESNWSTGVPEWDLLDGLHLFVAFHAEDGATRSLAGIGKNWHSGNFLRLNSGVLSWEWGSSEYVEMPCPPGSYLAHLHIKKISPGPNTLDLYGESGQKRRATFQGGEPTTLDYERLIVAQHRYQSRTTWLGGVGMTEHLTDEELRRVLQHYALRFPQLKSLPRPPSGASDSAGGFPWLALAALAGVGGLAWFASENDNKSRNSPK
jgi:hypothetical protein